MTISVPVRIPATTERSRDDEAAGRLKLPPIPKKTSVKQQLRRFSMKVQMTSTILGIAAILACSVLPHVVLADGVSSEKCSQLDLNLSPTLSIWAQTPTGIAAALSPEKVPSAVIAVEKKYAVGLAPSAAVNLALSPEGTMKSDLPHAGMLSLHIPSDGLYKVMVGKRARIDVVADGKIVPSTAYGENFPCISMKKFVAFSLVAGDVTLELSSVTSPYIDVLVVRDPI
jgi:hypothetical protein